ALAHGIEECDGGARAPRLRRERNLIKAGRIFLPRTVEIPSGSAASEFRQVASRLDEGASRRRRIGEPANGERAAGPRVLRGAAPEILRAREVWQQLVVTPALVSFLRPVVV